MLKFSQVPDLSLGQVNVIFGENGVGKTTLLREVYHQLGAAVPLFPSQGKLARLMAHLHDFDSGLCFVDDLDLGLSPLSLGLVMRTLRDFQQNPGFQLIATVRTPYAIGLFELDQLLYVRRPFTERDALGLPVYVEAPEVIRPVELRRHASRSAGECWTMGYFERNEDPVGLRQSGGVDAI